MKIFVCVSHVPDTETRIKVTNDGSSYDQSDISYVMNPYDELAVEEALKVSADKGGEVTVISVGSDAVINTIRKAVAMGATQAVHIKCDADIDGFAASKAVADFLKDKSPDLIFTGKESVDSNSGQFATFLAAQLDLPVINVAVKLKYEDGFITAHREVEGGKEVVECRLPAVVSCQKGLNEPRLPTLKGIMASKKVQPELIELSDPENRTKITKYAKPPEKAPGRIVGTDPSAVGELVTLLQNEAKVL